MILTLKERAFAMEQLAEQNRMIQEMKEQEIELSKKLKKMNRERNVINMMLLNDRKGNMDEAMKNAI